MESADKIIINLNQVSIQSNIQKQKGTSEIEKISKTKKFYCYNCKKKFNKLYIENTPIECIFCYSQICEEILPEYEENILPPDKFKPYSSRPQQQEPTLVRLTNPNNEYNIFQDLDDNTYKQFRKEMISCVLATDMAFHSNYVNFMKVKIDDIKKEGQNNNKNDDYQNYMNLLVHSADISNPTKPFDIYFKWAKLVVNEFYDQGDQEKKLGMNCSCDRDKVTIYQSQLGFINFIELPYFSFFLLLPY